MHPIHRVVRFEKIAPFTLAVTFEDGTTQIIDFRSVSHGAIYGPLADAKLFDSVRIDEEAHTLIWPNGADFDPTMLHDWPEKGPHLARLTETWGVKAG